MGLIRWLVVTISVVVLTTLGINAFDNLDQPGNSLIGAALKGWTASSACPEGMALIATSEGDFCIDQFEASTGGSCPAQNPVSKQDTDDNLAIPNCKPVSEQDEEPWRNISRQQAELACARAGKRLPTNNEWYRAALGTPDKTGWGREDCNLDNVSASDPDKTGSRENCASPLGVYDMIGNVWEWQEETVTNGVYKNTPLPSQGYVVSIDSAGMPLETNIDTPDAALFDDYFWHDPTDARGILRGGYWKSETDGGQYAVNITVPPSFVGNAVGFRCVTNAAQ